MFGTPGTVAAAAAGRRSAVRTASALLRRPLRRTLRASAGGGSSAVLRSRPPLLPPPPPGSPLFSPPRRRAAASAPFSSSSSAASPPPPPPSSSEEAAAPAAAAPSPVVVVDHFSALGLPRAFDAAGPSELKAAYRGLMAELHPDRHAGLSPEERARTGERAAAVTRAHDVLKDDMLRAEHLLELRGAGLDERDGGELVGPEILTRVMELREAVDDAAAAGDDGRLGALLDENRRRVDSAAAELAAAFAADEYGEARRLTAKLRYWRRIEETILEKIGTVEE